MSPKKAGFFSAITSREDAVNIAKDCASGFFAVAAIQAALSFIIGYSVLVDAAIYVTCGFFIRQFYSRTAAVIVLALAVITLIVTFINMVGANLGGGNNIFLALIIGWAAIRAVEATFKVHGKYSATNVPPREGLNKSPEVC